MPITFNQVRQMLLAFKPDYAAAARLGPQLLPHLKTLISGTELMALLNDRDAGVRKLAVKSSATRDNSALLAKIGALSRQDPSPATRSLAARVVRRSHGGRLG